MNTAATYSPRDYAQVPSAMRDLTSLFGMGRGEHPRHNHHKIFEFITHNYLHIGKAHIQV